MSRPFWNDERDAILRKMYPSLPNNDIADILGCTDSTVGARAKILGLAKAKSYDQYAFMGRYVHKGRYRNYERRE